MAQIRKLSKKSAVRFAIICMGGAIKAASGAIHKVSLDCAPPIQIIANLTAERAVFLYNFLICAIGR